MQQFVLVGSQGSFTVPHGESCVGSDAACQICIRGEGVLPIHAYLRTDGEKLLIRPADAGSSSSGYGTGSVLVNGKPLGGPVVLSGGQEVSIGAVQMRLIANAVKRPSIFSRLWSKKWFRGCTWAAGGVFALLLVAYCVLIYVILDPKALKEHISKAVSAHLLRDDTEIESVQVDLVEGLVNIKNVQIKDRDSFISREGTPTPFIQVPSATVKFELWPLLKSWFKDYKDLRIVLKNPKVNIERARSDGSLNIKDLLTKYTQSRSSTMLPIEKINARLEIEHGEIRLRDNFTNIGETSLEDINVVAVQPAEGAPLAIEKCEMKVSSIPAPQEAGSLNLSGHVSLLDSSCVIDSAAICSEDLKLDMKNFDLARIFEHLGYAWEPYGLDFKLVLGKPISGSIGLKIKNMASLRLMGAVKSDSLISIREQNRPPIGNIPMELTFDMFLNDNGHTYIPSKIVDLSLRSGSDLNNRSTTHLLFVANGGMNPNGTREYTVSFECILQDLLGTDVGKRLDLAGRLGGRMQGNAQLLQEANGSWKIDAKSSTGTDAYVMVSDSSQPDHAPVRQPLPVTFECHASAQPNQSGGINELQLDRFAIKAPSFEASSEVPGVIRVDQKSELETQAQFKLALKGREFWKEFKPILALFGFNQPIEEALDLKVTVVGSNDLVKVVAKGNAARQWAEDPAPVQLETYLEFNRKVSKAGQKNSAEPYLGLMLEVASAAEATPLYVRIDALCSRDQNADTMVLERTLQTDNEVKLQPGLIIRSDISTLRERLKPYIEGYLRAQDANLAKPELGWLKFYRDSALTGQLEQSGRLVFKKMHDPKSPLPDVVEFDLQTSGKNLRLNMPLAPTAKETKNSFNWKEDAVSLGLKGSYLSRASLTKEEPDLQRLNVERMDVRGSVGTFSMTLQDLDAFRLLHLSKLPKFTWTDCVAKLTMSGQVDPPAYDFARAIQVLPMESPLAGSLALQITFDREKDALDLERFVYKQVDKRPNAFLVNLDAGGSLLRIRELSSRLFSTLPDAPPFAEQLENFLADAGPSALLDHLGDQLTLNSLQMDAPAFIEWLRQDYKDGRQPPAFLASILRNDWRPEGKWEAAGVRFSRSDPKIRKWELVGAFRNDLTTYGVAAADGKRPISFSFSDKWALRMGVAVAQNDNTVAIEVDEAALDKAHIFADLPQLKFSYDKPSGEPCKLEIAQCLYSHGLLAQIGRLKLKGKPVAIEMKDFDANLKTGSCQIAEAIINGGPMPCALAISKYDPANDHINARINAPVASIEYLTSLLPTVPPALKISGSLKDLSLAYKGSLIGLQAAFLPDTAAIKRRFPALEDNDTRLLGINPESDAIEADAESDLALKASGKSGEANLKVSGHTHLTTRDLAWKNLSVNINVKNAKDEAKSYTFATPNLQANSSNAKLHLLRAYKTVGMPLNVSANLNFTSPLDFSGLTAAHDLVAEAAGIQAPNASAERRLAALDQFVFSGNINAPKVLIGSSEFPAIQAQNVTLKQLKLNVPLLATTAYGGNLQLDDADFDLAKAVAIREGDSLQFKDVAFKLRMRLLEGEISKILYGPEPPKDGYRIAGKVEAQGNLEGVNFAGIDRHMWNGAVKFKISGVTVNAPLTATFQPDHPIAPWSSTFLALGPTLYQTFMKAANNDSTGVADMTQHWAANAANKAVTALAISLQAYLAKTLGYEIEKLELEPFTPTVVIDKGFAKIDPFSLVGRGKCDGLELQLRNFKINLAEEAFADELLICPLALPPASKDVLRLMKWRPPDFQRYMASLQDGKFSMRVFGRLSAPMVKFPWPELRALATKLLFDRDDIQDLDTLELSRRSFAQTWGSFSTDVEVASAVADRLGVGLPGTVTARLQGQSVIDRVPNLPKSLHELLSVQSAPLTPAQSLNKLLFPPPDVPLNPANTPEKQGTK